MAVSMGKDVIMTHLMNAIRANIGTEEKVDEIDAAADIFKLGKLSPVVDTITGEVLGFEWKIVVKKHENAVKPSNG
jgi:hypothetical protein